MQNSKGRITDESLYKIDMVSHPFIVHKATRSRAWKKPCYLTIYEQLHEYLIAGENVKINQRVLPEHYLV